LAFAGHGLQFDPEAGKAEEKADAYFCPRDANPHQRATLVSLRDIYYQMEQSGAGVRLMLVDACRNDPGKARRRAGVTAGTGPRPPEGVAVLFSCSRGQYSHEHADLKHGIFFHYVLEGLRGRAKDDEGAVTWDSLSAYVKREVSRAVPKLVGNDAQ